MRAAQTAAVLMLAPILVACGGGSQAAQAKAWVTDNGGTLAQGAQPGWSASERDWKGTWPWPKPYALVSCAPDLYGGVTYVQLGGHRYWLLETHGYPPDGSTFTSSAADIETDTAAEVEWSRQSGLLCGIGQ